MASPSNGLPDDLVVTGDVTAAAGPSASPGGPLTAGAVVAGRYRLVALLGRGGMGEVYRADDLALGQPVALKFLPGEVAASDRRLEQFHNELRTARQVSHKHVCRLYDMGEAGGRRFLTMEYVDGEDLASLLRRVGRIPQDRAVQMARQLCSGVAAAHERNVVHRDLKPSNVMIDGDGDVRITDFGIATSTATGAGRDVAGTPGYMAPEQLAGEQATIRSDIYSLGLILYELFTGRRAIDSKTVPEIRQFHQTGTITTPSSIVPDLDPVVERVILRCLERDPERRPASALAVAAALPGGDPLAVALAAGETPSPELLAAAGEAAPLAVGRALSLTVVVVAGLLAFAWVSARTSFVGRTPLERPPDVLVDRAEQIMTSLGYPADVVDRAHGFGLAMDYLVWLRGQRRSADRWAPLSSGDPSAVRFWYRTSPQEMIPAGGGDIDVEDPPLRGSDMRLIVLDTEGRLRHFRAVPPQRDARPAGPAVSWAEAFASAGLDLSSFSPVAPEWTPRDYADDRAAWEGPLGREPGLRVRVEAAAYGGRLTWFEVVGPWTRPTLMTPVAEAPADRIVDAAIALLVVVLAGSAFVLARRSLRINKGDRAGATRLAAGVAISGVLAWAVGADHSAAIDGELDVFIAAAGPVAFAAFVLWTFYIALEPYVRRFWPDSLLGWSRLLAGRLLNPRFGRDLLTGLAAGMIVTLIELGKVTIPPAIGRLAPHPTYGDEVALLSSPAGVVATWIVSALEATGNALLFVLLVVVVRLVTRRNWPGAIAAMVLLSIGSMQFMASAGTLALPFPLLAGALLTAVLFRAGVLPLAVALMVRDVLLSVPFAQNPTHWSATAGNWTVAAVIGLTAFAFYASRVGEPLFGQLLDDRLSVPPARTAGGRVKV